MKLATRPCTCQGFGQATELPHQGISKMCWTARARKRAAISHNLAKKKSWSSQVIIHDRFPRHTSSDENSPWFGQEQVNWLGSTALESPLFFLKTFLGYPYLNVICSLLHGYGPSLGAMLRPSGPTFPFLQRYREGSGYQAASCSHER